MEKMWNASLLHNSFSRLRLPPIFIQHRTPHHTMYFIMLPSLLFLFLLLSASATAAIPSARPSLSTSKPINPASLPIGAKRFLFSWLNTAAIESLLQPALQIDAPRCAQICLLSPKCGGVASSAKSKPTDWRLIFGKGVYVLLRSRRLRCGANETIRRVRVLLGLGLWVRVERMCWWLRGLMVGNLIELFKGEEMRGRMAAW
jgi:hypothetical protein